MSGDYRIGKAASEDEDAILELLYLLKQMYGSIPKIELAEFQQLYRASLSGFMEAERSLLLVARTQDNQVVGVASFTWRWVLRLSTPLATFEELYVRLDHRQQHLATALWATGVGMLKAQGIQRVEVTTSLAHPGQRQFAKSIGMEWYSSVQSVAL